MEAHKRVNILGAGVCGLSVALEIKQKWGNAVDVVVTAENSYDNTTSYIAGELHASY
jgi:aspartate oxidase